MHSPEFVLHGTSSAEGAAIIESEGFKTKEAFPNVSENLIYALKWATDKEGVKYRTRPGTVENSEEPGRIILMRVPEGLVVKYGNITEMNVDTETKNVTGHVKNYTSGRNQLAFYHEEESERHPGKSLSTNAEIVASIVPTPELVSLLDSLKEEIRSLGKIDSETYAMQIAEIFLKDSSNKLSYAELLPTLQHLVRTTIESEVIHTMRLLELNVLRAKGYKTFNNNTPIDDWQFMDREKLHAKLEDIQSKSENLEMGAGSDVLKRYLQSGAAYLLLELERF